MTRNFALLQQSLLYSHGTRRRGRYDTAASLREITSEQWRRMELPGRILQSIRAKLGQGYGKLVRRGSAPLASGSAKLQEGGGAAKPVCVREEVL